MAIDSSVVAKGFDLLSQIFIYGQRQRAKDNSIPPIKESTGQLRGRIEELEKHIDQEIELLKAQRAVAASSAGNKAEAKKVAKIPQKFEKYDLPSGDGGESSAEYGEDYEEGVEELSYSTPQVIEKERKEQKEQKGLGSHSGAGIGMACLPCTRAHLVAVRGTLKEALRFALGEVEGVQHPEVVERLDAAAEELTVMERFDLSPEKIAKTSPEERAVINTMLPKLRDMRQKMLNGVPSPEALQDLAVAVDEVYKQVRTNSGGSGIDWSKVNEHVEANM